MRPNVQDPSDPTGGAAGISRRLTARVMIFTSLLLLLITGLISSQALNSFEREVAPRISREGVVIGESVLHQVARAVSLGVPLESLRGMEEFLESYLEERAAIDYLALEGASGRILYMTRRPGLPPIEIPTIGSTDPNGQHSRETERGFNQALPLEVDGRVLGWLHVGVNRVPLERVASDSRWDIAIVLLVALLATSEFLSFLTERALRMPLRMVEGSVGRMADSEWTQIANPADSGAFAGLLIALNRITETVHRRWTALVARAGTLAADRAEAAGRILERLRATARFGDGPLGVDQSHRGVAAARAPLFLFVFGEQLSTSFIPLYARSLYEPGGWLTAQWAVGIPITVFAATIALATPRGAHLVARWGARRVLVIGCLPAIVGHLISAFAPSIDMFTLGRAVCAVGYAFVTIACQGYIAEGSSQAGRARNVGIFVTAVMTGAVCGTAIGAVIADRIGYSLTFVVSALLVSGVALLGWLHMIPDVGKRSPVVAPVGERKTAAPWRALLNPQFLGLIVLAAIPAKIVLTGFIFYTAPLYLYQLNLSQSAIGRNVMLYGLVMLLTIPAGAWIADRFGRSRDIIVAAGVVNGLALLTPMFIEPQLAMPIAIAVTGLCQGLAAAPQLAIVPALCPEESQQFGSPVLFGYLRFAERIGSLVAPLLAALLVTFVGYEGSMVAVGILSLIPAVTFGMLGFLSRGRTQKEFAK